MAQVAHYIHLNPVRAKVVRVERMREYPWSSLALFASPQRPAVLVADTVLGESEVCQTRPPAGAGRLIILGWSRKRRRNCAKKDLAGWRNG